LHGGPLPLIPRIFTSFPRPLVREGGGLIDAKSSWQKSAPPTHRIPSAANSCLPPHAGPAPGPWLGLAPGYFSISLTTLSGGSQSLLRPDAPPVSVDLTHHDGTRFPEPLIPEPLYTKGLLNISDCFVDDARPSWCEHRRPDPPIAATPDIRKLPPRPVESTQGRLA